MAYEQTKLLELVDRAVGHRWSIPEFQRRFVWKPTQVRDLAESLWLDYRTTATESGGQIKFSGAIDVPEINREIAEIMEGGVEAFKLRFQKDGF